MTLPIVGQIHFVCVACNEPVRKAISGAVTCSNDKCARWGLLSLIAKDPEHEGEVVE